jgi:membrane associated rhomboid family serine protease
LGLHSSRFPDQLGVNAVTIFSAMFMHGGWMHLFGNMLFLWIFGDNVEDRLGHAKFLIFYLLAGLAATLAQFAISPGSSVPNVGASGAIAGVLGAYILMFPQSRVNVLLGRQIVAMPAIFVLGMWIVPAYQRGLHYRLYRQSANAAASPGPYRYFRRPMANSCDTAPPSTAA